jgi:hypothetical protein
VAWDNIKDSTYNGQLMPTKHPALRALTILSLTLCGCIPFDPGDPVGQLVTKEGAVGGNSQRGVLTWARVQVYSCIPSGFGTCALAYTEVPVERELAVLDLASLAVTTTPIPAQSAMATDGQWLVIQDSDAAVVRVHDLESDTDVAQLPIASQRFQTAGWPAQTIAYYMPIAVAKPFVLLAYDPDLAQDEPMQPVVLNVTTGEKRAVPDVQAAASGWCALSQQYLAYLSLEEQIVLLDLSTGTSSVIASV